MRLNCFWEILVLIQVEVLVFFFGASWKMAFWDNAMSFPFLLYLFVYGYFPFRIFHSVVLKTGLDHFFPYLFWFSTPVHWESWNSWITNQYCGKSDYNLCLSSVSCFPISLWLNLNYKQTDTVHTTSMVHVNECHVNNAFEDDETVQQGTQSSCTPGCSSRLHSSQQ
jgi:hypothetical protein